MQLTTHGATAAAREIKQDASAAVWNAAGISAYAVVEAALHQF